MIEHIKSCIMTLEWQPSGTVLWIGHIRLNSDWATDGEMTDIFSGKRNELFGLSKSPLRHCSVSDEARLTSSSKIQEPVLTASTKAPW